MQYRLTYSDLSILRLIAQGMSDEEIATRLNVDVRSAKSHIQSEVNKMMAPSRYQAAVRALREGLIGSFEPSHEHKEPQD